MRSRYAPLTNLQTDIHTRESDKRMSEFLAQSPFISSEFSHAVYTKENTTSSPVSYTSLEIPHALGFIPLDVWSTFVDGGTVAWKYGLFTNTSLFADITVNANAILTLRYFAGRYKELQ